MFCLCLLLHRRHGQNTIEYGIDIEGDLASMVPLELREDLPENEET